MLSFSRLCAVACFFQHKETPHGRDLPAPRPSQWVGDVAGKGGHAPRAPIETVQGNESVVQNWQCCERRFGVFPAASECHVVLHRGRAKKTQTVGKNETKSVERTTQNGERQKRREQWWRQWRQWRQWREHLVFRKEEFQQKNAVGNESTQIVVRSSTHGQTSQRGELHVENGCENSKNNNLRDARERESLWVHMGSFDTFILYIF